MIRLANIFFGSFVAHALLRAVSALLSTPVLTALWCRQACRHGTQECVRHIKAPRNSSLFAALLVLISPGGTVHRKRCPPPAEPCTAVHKYTLLRSPASPAGNSCERSTHKGARPTPLAGGMT